MRSRFDDPARTRGKLPAARDRHAGVSSTSSNRRHRCRDRLLQHPVAKAVPRGLVYAVDIEPAMLEHVRKRAAAEKLGNVVTVQASGTSPKLPKPADVVIVVDTYHHLPNRPTYFSDLRKSLAPGGRVAIVDFRKDSPEGPPPQFRSRRTRSSGR